MSLKLAEKSSAVRWQTGRLSLKLAVLTFFCVACSHSAHVHFTAKKVAATALQKYQVISPLGLDAEIWESLILKNNPTELSVRSRRNQ